MTIDSGADERGSLVGLGEVTATGTDAWRVAVRIPAIPHLSRGSTMPVLLGLDLVRRLGEVLATRCLGVPEDHELVVRRISFQWSGRPLVLPPAGTVGAGAFVRVHERTERHGVLRSFEASMVLRIGSQEVAHGGGAAYCLTPEKYAALRDGAPRAADRHDLESLLDVRRRGDRLLARLGRDASEPLTGPRLDRVSALAVAAGALRSAHLLRPAQQVGGISLSLERFVDSAPAPDVLAQADGDVVGVDVLQGRTVAARSVVRLLHPR